MAIREIPKSFEYQCDVCGKTHLQENANGHYTNSRPPHWAWLMVKQDAYDYQGAAVADGSINRLLCDECRPSLVEAVNAWAASRTKKEPAP
jgi:hypothetical protein